MPLTATTLQQFKRGNVFVETGTLHGDGVSKALAAGFKKIISIDIDPSIVGAARNMFSGNNEVEIVLGDTKTVFPEVITKIGETCTFWLDAHWDGGIMGAEMCPLYSELAAIMAHPVKDHTILIDDMRLVGVSPSHHWASTVGRDGIKNLLLAINKDYQISYTDGDLGPQYGGIAKNDIMVARL